MNEKVKNTARELYRDMRERRLLPVIAVLVIAIIAVPVALGSGGTEPVPQTELAVGLRPMLETQPVVLAEQPELRDFRKRLDAFEKKNPFHQPTPPKVASTDSSATTDTSATASDVTSGGTTPDVPTDIPTDPGTVPPTDTGDTGNTVPPADSGDTGGTGTTDTGGRSVISYDIDVLVGAVGDERELEGVKSLQLLPSEGHPVLQYVLTDLGGNAASFVVSSGVTGAEGDGRCAPSPDQCEFLRLAVGEAERLTYEPTGRTYRIKLLGLTRRVDPIETLSAAADDFVDPVGFAAAVAG